MSREQPLRKPERLRTCKKQFLSLLNLFLSLRVEFVHSVRLEKKARRIVAVAARLSNEQGINNCSFGRARLEFENFFPNDHPTRRAEVANKFADEPGDYFRVLSLERVLSFLRTNAPTAHQTW